MNNQLLYTQTLIFYVQTVLYLHDFHSTRLEKIQFTSTIDWHATNSVFLKMSVENSFFVLETFFELLSCIFPLILFYVFLEFNYQWLAVLFFPSILYFMERSQVRLNAFDYEKFSTIHVCQSRSFRV